MGLMNRISTVIKQKVNALLDTYEDPREALDYSYTKQLEMMNKLRRSLAEVITARKRLEMQKSKLWDNIRLLDEQARRSLDANREDLAKLAYNDICSVLGVELAEAMSTGLAPDVDKLADVAPTLPRSEAALLDRLLAERNIQPFGKMATATTGPTFAEWDALARV